MATHDYVIANGTGAAVRSDLNGALAAIVSNNSSATEPATMYAYQWWPDTTTGLLKQRNSANSAWITIGTLASANLGLLSLAGGTMTGALAVTAGTAALPGIAVSGDLNTGIFSPGADQLAISTGGTSRLAVSTTAVSSTLAVDVPLGAVGTPSLTFTGDLNTGIYSPGADQLAISTGGGQRINIEADGDINIDGGGVFYDATNNRLGIGTTSPGATLDVSGTVNFKPAAGYNALFQQSATALRINYLNDAGSANVSAIYRATDFAWQKGDGGEVARIDSSGRLLVGTSTSDGQRTASVQIASAGGLSGWGSSLNLTEFGASYNPYLILQRSRNGTIGSHTVLQSGDQIGGIQFNGSDGDSFEPAATINAFVDGTPGANDMPGRLVFSTTADGASSPTERMRIGQNGVIRIGQTTSDAPAAANIAGAAIGPTTYLSISRTADLGIEVNRISNDGNLIRFLQDGTEEGSISVSGTTVSYNGAHLSRWSQLPSGAEREEILRGSVLSNIDEMCEWSDEENEQLNRMKVSDVEGDKNVSGVFQCWDDDDDTYTNDFYCAMTGDFIIRIGDGVTVERGDLLMSAGDGTAKSQGDGYVQDKTIAKVTSTNVSCTYADGSYCVPCVLMAC